MLNMEIPQFTKGERIHSVIELEKAFEDTYELLVDFYNEITEEVMNYLS